MPGDVVGVEVVYCPRSGVCDSVNLSLPPGSTLAQALDASGVITRHSLNMADLSCGVWGRAAPIDAPLRDRDRIELYRNLTVDPKEARRLRYRGKRQPKPVRA